ncbi:alpha-2-macroglobulin receptor-associated protein-like [Diadema antillarum]|uniref:alpha-2-macroglobulin receptor-associated protein-like n=1 Tax=Diadema antillarum TaxID=105358 RepID=UPI003A859636
MDRKYDFATFLLVVGLCVCFCNDVSAARDAPNKYNQDMNRVGRSKFPDTEKQFRSRRVGQVWEKAMRMRLGEKKLAELQRDLERLDTMYGKMKKDMSKKDVSNDINPRDEGEMLIDRSLKEVMKRYGIAAKLADGKFPDTMGNPFTDPKVAQLWGKAQRSKMFAEDELAELKEELLSHQEKLESFNSKMDTLHGPDRDKKRGNIHPDEVHAMRGREVELKLMHRDISRDFQRLSAKTMPEDERGPFTEHRVITLWKEAKKQDFTEEEMAAIQEELAAFEGKILKHEMAQKAALEAEMDHRKSLQGKPGEKPRMPEPRELHNKARDLGQEVHSTMKDLRQRITEGKWREEL